jgi:RND family efflux transporter MFP subunit
MMKRTYLLLITPLLIIAACDNQTEEVTDTRPRPVLYSILEPQSLTEQGFTGSVEPRYSTDLAFRVLGNLTTKVVNVGDLIKRDEVVATIDPAALDLNIQSASANLASAQAQYASAAASEERNAQLLKSQNVSQANYDSVRQTRDSAAASLQKAQADYRKAQDQREFAQLKSDFDGVVSAVYAEVGQVVSAGQPILSVARSDIRDVVVDVPDHMNDLLQLNTKFDVILQADPHVQGVALVREVAPQADAHTRSRRLRLALETSVPDFRLGATVRVIPQSARDVVIIIPESAILERGGQYFVWIINPQSEAVSQQPISIVEKTKTGVLVNDLEAGSMVVTAGIHQLSQGQKVRLSTQGAADK